MKIIVRSNTVRNGSCRTNTGMRKVLFSHSGELRPVLYKVHSGFIPGRGTVQVPPENDDILICSIWSKSKFSIEVTKWDDENRTWVPIGDPNKMELFIETQGWDGIKDEGVDLYRSIVSSHPWLEEFLDPRDEGRATSFIPWEGDSLAERSKRRKIKSFLRTWKLDEKVREEDLMLAPKRDLILEPIKDKDVLNRIPEYRTRDGSVVSINTRETWYGYTSSRGGVPIELTVEYKEEHGSNYAHERTTRKKGSPLRDIPEIEKFVTLVCVTKGPYIKNHYSYGTRIEIFDVS